MSDTNEESLIIANATPLPDQLWAGVRQVAPPLMAFALGKGWIDNDLAALLGTLGMIVWPIVAGQLATRRRAKQLAKAAADPRNEGVVLK